MPMWDLRMWVRAADVPGHFHAKECGQPDHCRRTCSGGEAESGEKYRHITFNLIDSSNGEQAIELRRYQEPRNKALYVNWKRQSSSDSPPPASRRQCSIRA